MKPILSFDEVVEEGGCCLNLLLQGTVGHKAHLKNNVMFWFGHKAHLTSNVMFGLGTRLT